MNRCGHNWALIDRNEVEIDQLEICDWSCFITFRAAERDAI